MTIGQKFLKRVLNEAAANKPKDELASIKKRIADIKGNVEGESTNISDMIIDIGSMFGVPTRTLNANVQELKTSIKAAADRIKSSPTEGKNLSALHRELEAFKAGAVSEASQTDTTFFDKSMSILKRLGFSAEVLEDESVVAKVRANITSFNESGAIKRIVNRLSSLDEAVVNEQAEGFNNRVVDEVASVIGMLGIDLNDPSIVHTGKKMNIKNAIIGAISKNPKLKQAVKAFIAHARTK